MGPGLSRALHAEVEWMKHNPHAISVFNFDVQVFGLSRAILIHFGVPAKKALEKAYHDGTLAQWFPKEAEYIKYHAKEFKDVWNWIVSGIEQKRKAFSQRFPKLAERWRASKMHTVAGKAGDWLRRTGIPAIKNLGSGILYGASTPPPDESHSRDTHTHHRGGDPRRTPGLRETTPPDRTSVV